MTTRDDIYKLMDESPEEEIQPVARYLQYLNDRHGLVLAALLNAPQDDEPETEYERQAVDEAIKDLAAGRVMTATEILDDIS